MFSKNKGKKTETKSAVAAAPKAPPVSQTTPSAPPSTAAPAQPINKAAAPMNPNTGNRPMNDQTPTKPKTVTPSILSSDLFIKGDIETSGDVQIEGRIKGNIRAHLLTVGENAVIDGEVRADDATIHGTIKGTLRGYKVRLSSSARVEGDIIHKTIAIESGAHFQGSVTRDDDPTQEGKATAAKPKAAATTGTAKS